MSGKMNGKEHIQEYIRRTRISPTVSRRCRIEPKVLDWLIDLSASDKSGAVFYAFIYGISKGYRAAKAEEGRSK